MTTNRVLLAILLAGMVLWVWLEFGSSDEAKIRSGFSAVADLISKEAGESALESADRGRRLGDRFAEPFVVKVDEAGVQVEDTAQLLRAFVGLRHQAKTITVDFSSIEIEVDGRVADATARADVSGQFQGRSGRASWRVLTRWRKISGDWRLERFHVAERIEGGLFR
ncbi:MAG: DUF4440 domain-containing protein [Acidobacteriota bacterium]